MQNIYQPNVLTQDELEVNNWHRLMNDAVEACSFSTRITRSRTITRERTYCLNIGDVLLWREVENGRVVSFTYADPAGESYFFTRDSVYCTLYTHTDAKGAFETLLESLRFNIRHTDMTEALEAWDYFNN